MIINEYKMEADLIVLRDSLYYECDLDILSQKGLFRRIYKWTALLESLVDEKVKNPLGKVKTQLNKTITYLNKKKIWESLPNKEEQYTKVHIAYVDSITLWVYTLFKKNGAQLSLYEDGTYSYGCLNINKKWFRRISEKMLYGGSGIEECVQMYVKHPQMVDLGDYSRIKLLNIEAKLNTDIVAEILLPLYKCSTDELTRFKNKVIIFDQNLELSEVKTIQKKIATETAKVFGEENVLVKLHPSSRDVIYNNIKTFKNRLPFEIVIPYEDMNEKILISIFSTACMSPKLDFNQEPFVIFTYKLYGKKVSINDKYLVQINRLRNSYNDKSKIMVPSNVQEFEKILMTIKEK